MIKYFTKGFSFLHETTSKVAKLFQLVVFFYLVFHQSYTFHYSVRFRQT